MRQNADVVRAQEGVFGGRVVRVANAGGISLSRSVGARVGVAAGGGAANESRLPPLPPTATR
jgi:hypothetical protein